MKHLLSHWFAGAIAVSLSLAAFIPATKAAGRATDQAGEGLRLAASYAQIDLTDSILQEADRLAIDVQFGRNFGDNVVIDAYILFEIGGSYFWVSPQREFSQTPVAATELSGNFFPSSTSLRVLDTMVGQVASEFTFNVFAYPLNRATGDLAGIWSSAQITLRPGGMGITFP